MMRKFLRGGVGLLAVLAVVQSVGTWFSNLPPGARVALLLLQRFENLFFEQFFNGLPFLLFGALAAGLVSVFFEATGDTPAKRGRLLFHPILGVFAGALLGFCLPIGAWGSLPLARRLVEKGIPFSACATMMLAAPVINPIVLASSLAVWGPGPLWWSRIAATLAVAVLTGLVFAFAMPISPAHAATATNAATAAHAATAANAATAAHAADGAPKSVLRTWMATAPATANSASPAISGGSASARWRAVLWVMVDDIFTFGGLFVLASLLLALLNIWLPPAWVLSMAHPPLMDVLAFSGLGYLSPISPLTDAYAALAYRESVSPAAILAFWMVGSMLNGKTILVLLATFKTHVAMGLLFISLLLSGLLVFGLQYFAPGWGL